MRLVIVDTNVVVAGLLSGDADSPPVRILDAMLGATCRFVLSEALLAEYRTVLLRPKLRKLHQLTERAIDDLLVELAQQAIVMTPPPGPVAPEPGDQLLWDLLHARDDLTLVTGDKLLLAAADPLRRIVSPKDYASIAFPA